jgi:hypothetical protein
LESLLEEINRKWETSSYQSAASDVRIKYIKFMSDNVSNISSFSGKVDKMEILPEHLETGHDIPDRYVTWYVY